MKLAFPEQPTPTVEIAGTDERYPVNRIYCVGMNYRDHVIEFGSDPDEIDPVFFMKPGNAIVENGVDVPYPPGTENFHYEIELVVAIGKEASNISAEDAKDHIFGYAVGNDLTRRDLQLEMKDLGMPWDIGKGFDNSAPISSIMRASDIGHPRKGKIFLKVNGETKQDSDISDMIAGVDEIVSELSKLFILKPGDLIYTGTPSGIGPVVKGDVMTAGIEEVGNLTTKII